MCKRKNEKDKYLTQEVQRLFIAALQGERYKDILCLQLETGMRPDEVCALSWNDVDFVQHTITVRNTVHRERDEKGKTHLTLGETKGRKKRTIPLSNNAEQILLKHYREIEDSASEDCIFMNLRGRLIEPNVTLNPVLKRCQKKMREMASEGLEIPNFTAHALRHTFATRALERGVPQKVVATWLGHSTTRITGDVYSKVIPEVSQEFRQYVGNIIDFDDTAERYC